MYVESVKLNNFRNYSHKQVRFTDGLNVIVGKNATGKTNLLESVYICGLGNSARVSRDKDCIMWGQSGAYIGLSVRKRHRSHKIEIYIDAKEKKRVAIDGIPITRISQLIGVMNVVFFSPDEIKLVKDAPQERRRFMDISLSQQSADYLYSLSRYNAVLLRRNKLLKTLQKGDNLMQSLAVWDAQLSSEGAKIIKKRYEFVEKLKKFAKESHTALTLSRETLDLGYESAVERGELSEIERELSEKLLSSYEKDAYLQYTTVGPHRDDLKIAIDNIDVRKFGSQGQQRTAALSLKLSEISLFTHETGETPVLLLDDVLSELDADRRAMLLTVTSKSQTIITCTEYEEKVPANFIKTGESAD